MQVILERGIISTTVSGPVSDEVLDTLTRYREAGYRFKPSFRAGKWDGWSHLFSKSTRKFPAGLTDRVAKSLRDMRIDVVIQDVRKRPKVLFPESIELIGIDLRDQQLDAIEDAVNAGQGVIKAATGFGKTEVLAGLVQAIGRPTIIFINQQTLAYQTRERLAARLGREIGFVGDGVYQPLEVTVCMFQTAASLLQDESSRAEFKQLLAGFDVLLIDETHHGIAKTYMKVLKLIPAFYRLGVSATPFVDPPSSELALIGQTGEICYDFDLMDAVEAGIAVRPHCFFLDYAPQAQIKDGKEWVEVYEEAIVYNESRNKAIQKAYLAATAAGLPALIIVDRLPHGEELSRVLGIPFVSGQDKAKKRVDTFAEVNDGKIPGFISTVAGEGVDIPNLACIILAAGGKASHRVMQRIGRGIRVGKHAYCVVVDFEDNPTITNSINTDRKPNNSVKYHTKERKKAFDSTGFGFQVVSELPDLAKLGAV